MDNKALYSLSYGVFMLSTSYEGKINGCITNTCIQAASDPARVAISCINKNYTCELLKKSGVFALSILDQTCGFDLIRHFGMQSGRDVDKFEGMELPTDVNGLPYLDSVSCAVLSCHVVDSTDLGSHTLFIAEIDDARRLSGKPPMTYAYYQSDVKPKPAKPAGEKKIIAWKCRICGYIYEGTDLPGDFICPLCGHDASDFEPVYAE